ncbi:hypothetical protein D3C77_682390 [compost metagenome]
MLNLDVLQRLGHRQRRPAVAARPVYAGHMVLIQMIPAVIIEIRIRILQKLLMAVILLQTILEIFLVPKQMADAQQVIASHKHRVHPCLLGEYVIH